MTVTVNKWPPFSPPPPKEYIQRCFIVGFTAFGEPKMLEKWNILTLRVETSIQLQQQGGKRRLTKINSNRNTKYIEKTPDCQKRTEKIIIENNCCCCCCKLQFYQQRETSSIEPHTHTDRPSVSPTEPTNKRSRENITHECACNNRWTEENLHKKKRKKSYSPMQKKLKKICYEIC